ncbi:1,4-alpha-glucan branching protein GlgB [Halofilum ochraceum]|uniref:1,4-alpha-glucan branching protein GlgB n=1 Tax=Halofilum ochraceum TaxID=1611323 RepID=UPI001FE1AE14|nr:1,4-alpha-glucan branching protein GlgB [Halofilum ochraceum]
MSDPLEQIADGRHPRPQDVLGRQTADGRVRIRAWRPDAIAGRFAPDGPALQPSPVAGVFEWTGSAGVVRQPWSIEWRFPDGSTYTTNDFAAFAQELDAEERRAFHAGEHTSAWRMLGAHARHREGVDGIRFALWAPNAQRVSVVGEFNDWDGRRHPLTRHEEGIWEAFIPEAGIGDLYKFELLDAAGVLRTKSDPFARSTQTRPETASRITPETVYPWADSQWMSARPDWREGPLSVYEVHLGSWLRDSDGGFLGYRDLAARLAPYVSELGFTHIELLPVMEHPFDGSWGYQCTGWYAPTRRFGEPDDFRAFVDTLHRHGIGVILDWVPGHFPRDEHGLTWFDGTALFEPADPQRASMPDWGTLAFDLGRPEVRSFLISSALYWLHEFHIDGLRVDAVASILYLDYGRKAGEWTPNRHGGRESLEAIHFLQQLNVATHGECPDSFTIAEESTAWPGVTRPTDVGGLGFSMKWNMGWMHDTLTYLRNDPIHRRFHHEHLTFGLVYAFSENYVLPLSHDEVVHEKGSLLGKMPGDDWQRRANLRLLLLWQFTYPGHKLLFMGGEFGQPGEWDHDRALDWGCLQDAGHTGILRLTADLARLYRDTPALHARDFRPDGFAWIDCDDAEQSTLVFRRLDTGSEVVIALNFTPVVHGDFLIGLPAAGGWRECMNTDSEYYGGSGQGNLGRVEAELGAHQGQPASATITLPPLGGVILEREPDDV